MREEIIKETKVLLMEGALGERLKREYSIEFDERIAMASLVYSDKGKQVLIELWSQYIDIARKFNLPLLVTTPTRRANKERVELSQYDDQVIGDNVAVLKEVKASSGIELYIGGLMGCKGDAYTGEGRLTRIEAKEFHGWQIGKFKEAGVDFVYVGIMPVIDEALGVSEAASEIDIPYIISFTIERDGCLIDGTSIYEAIRTIDEQVERKPMCYMTNCVHPSIVLEALSQPCNDKELVRKRFLGIQANTSPLSYAELDGAKDLHTSNPEEFANEMRKLQMNKGLKIFGGCCGTDNNYMELVAKLITR